MKKITNILALAAVMAAFAAPAFAGDVVIRALPRMKFSGTKLDSTLIAVPTNSTTATAASTRDTTNWLDLGNYKFAYGVSASPLIQFQINHQVGAATDTMQTAVEWANDPNDLASFIPGSPAFAAPGVSGATIISGCDSDDLTCGRFVRVIVSNFKVASGVTRKFSVVPILRLAVE